MILVTGGAGYIGSHVVKNLTEKGKEVAVIDNLSTGHKDAVSENASFFELDLLDNVALSDFFQKYRPEAVMHFAAKSIVSDSVINPLNTFQCNLTGSINLLNAMVKYGTRYFVFSSTAAVYGEPEVTPITEDFNLIPTNPYGESKLFIEKILKRISDTGDINYIALRYFNAAGADFESDLGEDHRPETHLIPIVLSVAAGKRDSVTVFGNDYPTADGTPIRDYIHIKDLVSAHILSLESLLKKDIKNAAYNLGNEKGYSVMEIIEHAAKITGKEITTGLGARREGDPSILVASSGKIKKELGWELCHSEIDNIIESAWKFHLKFPDGFKG